MVVVFIHEYGHYLSARLFGAKVTDFSIGFGKPIYQFKDNIAQSQLALDEYKKGLQNMADNLNSPQPQYMSDVRFSYLLP